MRRLILILVALGGLFLAATMLRMRWSSQGVSEYFTLWSPAPGHNLLFVSHPTGWVELYFEWPQHFKWTAAHWTVAAASACVSLLCVSLVVADVLGWTKRYRQRSANCLRCGYDLRATPQRCPECGTDVLDARASGGLEWRRKRRVRDESTREGSEGRKLEA